MRHAPANGSRYDDSVHGRPLALFFVSALVQGCAEPTAIEVGVTSELDCSDGAQVALIGSDRLDDLAGRAPSSVATRCVASGSTYDRGRVVVVPNGRSDQIALAVATRRGGGDPSTCLTAPKDCIVAKRQLRFVSHNTLRMQIALRRDCLGVLCSPDTTCDRGLCVPAVTACGANGCDLAGDGGAPVTSDAGPDAAPPDAGGCTPPYPLPFAGVPPTHLWHFDEGVGTSAASSGATPVPPATLLPTAWVPGPSASCGSAVSIASPIVLAPGYDHPKFAFSFWIHMVGLGGPSCRLLGTATSNGGWFVDVQGTMLRLNLAGFGPTGILFTPSGWTRVSGSYDGSFVRLYVDGSAGGGAAVPFPPGGTLTVGPCAAEIDELHLWDTVPSTN
jgi:hypothetical protein